MITLNLNIVPVPKQRPRATKTGRVYTPRETADYERTIARMVGHHQAILGAISIEVLFVLKRPSRTPKALTGRFMKAGSRGDLDNYIKALLDGCQKAGLVPNDAAVTQINARKVYCAEGEEPHIELRLWSLGEQVVFNDDLEVDE